MNRIKQILLASSAEVIIVLTLAFCVSFFDEPDSRINADGHGYYEYLPAIFLRGDFDRSGNGKELTNPGDSTYITVGGDRVQKYTCGVAILQAPFFIGALPFIQAGDDGYSSIFNNAIYIAALFYLWVGLVALRKLLESYNAGRSAIIIVQVALAFATSLMYYTVFNSSYSHVYSFAALTVFMLLARRYFSVPSWRGFYLATFVFGMVILIRPVNFISLAMIPLLAGSKEQLIGGLRFLWRDKWKTLTGLVIPFFVFSLQSIAWYVQSGRLFVDTYPNEHFIFTNPRMLQLLFGFGKGVFIYAPVLLLFFAGIIVLLKGKQYYLVVTAAVFLFVITYLLSCWGDIRYGCSFGSRIFIDFYGFLAVFMALGITAMPELLKRISVLYVIACSVLSFVQVWQYNNYVLHWWDMNFDRYCKVFLKTDPIYRGLLFKPVISAGWTVHEEIAIANHTTAEWHSDTLVMEYYDSSLVSERMLILVSTETDFEGSDRAEINVEVQDSITGRSHCAYSHFLFQFPEELNPEVGQYPYYIPPIAGSGTQRIIVRIFTKGKPVTLRNFRATVFKTASG